MSDENTNIKLNDIPRHLGCCAEILSNMHELKCTRCSTHFKKIWDIDGTKVAICPQVD